MRASSDERRRSYRANGIDEISFQISRQSDANDLDISKETRKAIDQINPTLPKGTKLKLAQDHTEYTSAAIKDVWFTMIISLDRYTQLVAFVWMLFGLVVYFLYGKNHSHLNNSSSGR